ncbi:GLPGLI family protein [Elizabethkingia meningoseptica]|uniref:GLPGLI family protein n=1 Tax=Elizabethkingia meningoseptica TaxID=238 RepID=UPI000841CE44|nr:GLPGLI family protein [Elizabethkingia meningoseptica]MEC4710931.1 GLPGLI family protein [Elizabethkingia meningoseptica]ODM53714.1 hypothetical protein BES09_05755 [Elizabethkingia meningoseptica]OHT28939.1 hypothetical protein BFF93_05760 [Elizabethkingia meningoseptica]OPC10501.1 hypothetical protein BAX93_08545 [Elizabethkingia meningoseptica]
MKKISLIFLILICSFCFSQKTSFKSDFQIIYGLDFKPDSTSNKSQNEIVSLYIGKNTSVFQDNKKFQIDSLIASQKYFQFPSKPLFKVNHVIFKDFTKVELVYSEMIDKVLVGYKEPLLQMKWNLKNESKEILTYTCYKAETEFRGRKYIAWYTKEIPSQDGPYKFAGLPGLILEVYDNKENFHYKLLAIIKKPKEILYDTNIHITDRKKLVEAKMNIIMKNSKSIIRFNPLEID